MFLRCLSRSGILFLFAGILALSYRPSIVAKDPSSTVQLPTAFDLRQMDWVTPIKSQAGGTCWTHGTMAAIESHLLVSGYWKGAGNNGNLALSEYHLDWWNGFNKHHNQDIADPTKDTSGLRVHNGGDYRVATAYLSRGDGVVILPNEHTPYQDKQWYAKAPSKSDEKYQRLYVRDVEWFTIGDNLEGIHLIKKRIMTDGAMGTCYSAGKTYLGKDNVQYQPPTTKAEPNHAVAIVGWDDNKISTDDTKKAPKPGAWLIKNSWGTKRGDQGYYWISYYDKHCCRDKEMGAVSFRNIEPMIYTDIYYHDVHGWRDTLPKVSKAFNAFTSTGRQMIRAVSFYTTKHEVNYTVKLYKSFNNGNLENEVSTKSGHIAFCGFHTINLDIPVIIQNDEKFYVYVELSDGGHAIDRTSQILVLLDDQPQPKEQPKTPAKEQPKTETKEQPKKEQPKTDLKEQPKKEQPKVDPKVEPKRGGRGAGAETRPWVPSKANPGESFYHDGTAWKDLYEYKFDNEKYLKSANFCIKALAVAAEESPNSRFALMLDGLSARNIGPANMSGRIVDVSVLESDPKTMYVATANGGVWKTTNNGDSWEPLFDKQDTLCIGAVAVSQSKPEVVYVGTGEGNPRNSVSWGNGIYKSVDAGKTWVYSGLPESHHIGRIVVHPTNPDIAYAAVLGHFWGSNKERGLYKTENGGRTWRQVLFLDETTGCVDVTLDPSDPNLLYTAAYPVQRDAFSGGSPKTQFGPKGGLYRSEDAGKTWTRMTNGLPDTAYGRCGLSIYRKDSKILYAIVQTDKTDDLNGNRGQAAKANEKDIEKGGVFRSEDKGKSWKKVNDLVPRPFYYGQIRVDPNDDKQIYVLGVAFSVSSDGGKTFTSPRLNGVHSDHHALWIDPKDSKHIVLGNDGGLYFSTDKAKSFEAIRGMAIGQFYAIAVDMRKPYRVYGGLQDNGSWGGPSATERSIGITLEDWKRIGGGDGFQTAVDPTDPDTVYAESQYGVLTRVNLKGKQSAKRIRPVPPKSLGAGAVGGGAAGETTSTERYRFNWNSPLVLSSHDPKTLYYGGNKLFKSTNRGDKWDTISPDLTREPFSKVSTAHTISALAESPVKATILYAGTDDGKLHVTKDGGKTWIDLSEKIPGLPPDRWISRIECSYFEEGTAFVAVDRHRNDDFRPYLFKTTDFGMTWTSLTSDPNLDSPIHVVRQSSTNRNLLFVGSERGLFSSIDGGKRWHRMTNGLPPALTVHDLVIHPRDRELVIGTHARSVYVMDVAPLEALAGKTLTADAHLFPPKPVLAFKPQESAAASKNRDYKGSNPPYGATIQYFLSNRPTGIVTLTVSDSKGKVLANWSKPASRGFHQFIWDLRANGDKSNLVPGGEYTVVLKAGDMTRTEKLKVESPGEVKVTSNP